ncbi:MAG: response regulator [Candidatus Omnitrophica bacterium]|nr:response regulator [Candidatus Omnitrophota bacterium]
MRKKILIIDDDKDFVAILKHNLEKREYDVTYAYDGRAGVEKARIERPDLIILDIMLPEVDGYKVSRLLKFDMKYKNIPIIIFSSRYDEAAALSREAGADAYLAKSAEAKELFEKVESLLRGKPSKPLGIQIEYPPMPFLGEVKETKDATVDELKLKIKRLVAINEVVYDINRSFEVDICVKKFIEKISAILTAEISSLMLLDKKKDELVVRIAKGMKDDIIKIAKTKLGEGISGWVAKEAKPLLIEDMKKQLQFKTRDERNYKTNSFMSVPLMVDSEVLGVVNVTDKIDKTSFTKEDLDILVSIANNAAASIKNSIHYEELKRLNKVKSDFLAVLSHELKAPLINVKGSIDALLKDSYDILNEDQRRFLSIAKNNIERLLRLIDDLLDISKLESGAVSMKRDRLDIANLIRSITASFKPELEKKSIDLNLNLPEENLIWGDSDRLEQVFNNIVSNAIKFTSQQGRIEFTFEDIGDNIRITMSDNGPGISKENLPKVFDKFSSLGVVDSGIVKGTGIGLSIAKDIVEMHKGSIWVESELGKGSKFFVELPKDLRKR